MNISLRKASHIQTAINDVLRAIETHTELAVNEFENAEEMISAANANLKASISRREQLNTVLYNIRKAIGSANTAAGVDSKLADVAQLEKTVQFFSTLAATKPRLSAAVIEGKLEKIRNPREGERNIYGRSEEVITTVVTEDDIKSFKNQLVTAKKQKQKLQDEILELNVRTEIQLSDSEVQTLQQEGIL